MHHIHHTEGIILSSKNYGETGKYYAVFTRDLGMIYAGAQGVRKMSSKLRFVLQDFSYVKMDFVRGKDFWRVTSASKTNKLDSLKKDKEKLKIFSNIATLLKRLLAGEDQNKALFEDLLEGLFFLEKKDCDFSGDIEAVIVLRILNSLGYIDSSNEFKDVIENPFGDSLLALSKEKRKRIFSEINRALKETHL